MKTVTKEVSSSKKKVGEAVVQEAETWQDLETLRSDPAVGEARILALYNSAVMTAEMNRIRAEAAGKPTKQAIRSRALAMVTTQEFGACEGDMSKLEALVQSKIALLESQWKAENPGAEEDSENGQ